MNIWPKAFQYVIQNEGIDATDDPSDRGGLTKFGIAKKYYPDLDIANLTLEQAKLIYYNDYWLKSNAHRILGPITSIKYFDICVNCGLYAGALLLQKTINIFNQNIEIDGIVGLMTLSKLNELIGIDDRNDVRIAKVLANQLIEHYRNIIKKNPAQKKFERGWMNRANRMPQA